jgi:hypothetical protein
MKILPQEALGDTHNDNGEAYDHMAVKSVFIVFKTSKI